MDLTAKQQHLIDELLFLPDPQERLAELVRRAQNRSLEEIHKTDANLVRGCVSRVWLHGEKAADQDQWFFAAEADSPMVKGLVICLCDLYSGATTAEIQSIEPVLWQASGLVKALSPTRLNGLAAVRRKLLELVA